MTEENNSKREPLLIGCSWSEDNNRQCFISHCHCCKKKMDSSCICSECACDARDGWLTHLHEHKEKHNPKPEICNMCALEIDGVGGK